MTNVRTLLQEGIDEARRLKLGDVELVGAEQASLSIKVFQGEVDSFSFSQTMGVGVRLFRDGRCGYAYTEEVSPEALRKTLRRAAEVSALLPVDPHQRLPEAPAQPYPSLTLYDDSFVALDHEAKIAMAKQIEQAAKEYHKLVVNVPQASYGEGMVDVALATSSGLDLHYRANGGYVTAGVMARRGKRVESAFEVRYAKSADRLSAREVARLAAEESVRRLDAKAVKSGAYPLLFDPRTARSLLATFAGIFSAKRIQEGLSLLKGRLGETIAASGLVLRDNALLPGGFATRPFDAEGVPSRNTVLIKDGVLQNVLHNAYTADKDGTQSTGNAARPSVKSAVEVAPSNLYLERGHQRREQLLGQAAKGILVVQLDGLHSGANPVSGDFSLAAHGYYFEKGEICYPLQQFTIAGNFLRLLREVVALGDDLEFGPPGGATSVGSPSLLVSGLAVGGG
ncbi:MAG: TldD/PmbA family protein [Candidatus Tectomicrobia bacterium]|nr:TldD/PmbA family protein [Candidatus Tectomicrobia bacterium]